MVARLEDPLIKLIRAKEHLDCLQAELGMFSTSNPCSVSIQRNSADGRKVLYVQIPVPPLRLGILAGDVFFALRSALDHLAWQLAKLTTDAPHERTQFPVAWRYADDTDARLEKDLRDIPPAAAYEIKALQPYHRGDSYKLDPLWQIDRLCNVDRHSLIPAKGGAIEFLTTLSSADIASAHYPRLGEVVFMLTAEGSAKVQLAPQATAQVVFGGPPDLQLAIGDIRSLYEYVSQTVFPKFRRFFERGSFHEDGTSNSPPVPPLRVP